MNNIDINKDFKHALSRMEQSDDNVFITGKAGTGKSTLLGYFCETTIKNCVVLAPTGVAALNVGGQTIHSFFNFYVDVTPEKIINKEVVPYSKQLYRNLTTIIIDEISMVRADLMDCIDVFLRLYGPTPNRAFGGVQMLFFGDLYQLPPVVPKTERDIFKSHYASPFFFSAHAFKETTYDTIQLKKIYRQKDKAFIELLDNIRQNNISFQQLKALNVKCLYQTNKSAETTAQTNHAIHLTTTNQKADSINATHLEKLEGEPHQSKAKVVGEFSKEYYPTHGSLNLKAGAQVMLVNNDTDKRWHNGSIGVIEKFVKQKRNKTALQIRLHESQETVLVSPHKWEVFRFHLVDDKIVSTPVGTFTQYPVRLAWAITIHKSQGKTFDNVVIDLGRGTFVPGQLYVALSRCTSLEGIVLKQPIQRRDIETDPSVVALAQ